MVVNEDEKQERFHSGRRQNRASPPSTYLLYLNFWIYSLGLLNRSLSSFQLRKRDRHARHCHPMAKFFVDWSATGFEARSILALHSHEAAPSLRSTTISQEFRQSTSSGPTNGPELGESLYVTKHALETPNIWRITV